MGSALGLGGSGLVAVTKDGAGALTLSAPNTFSGGFTVGAGSGRWRVWVWDADIGGRGGERVGRNHGTCGWERCVAGGKFDVGWRDVEREADVWRNGDDERG
jgi:autotransporter-associated beta strand protein